MIIVNRNECGICGGERNIGEAPALLAHSGTRWLTVLPCRECRRVWQHLDGTFELDDAQVEAEHRERN